MGSEALRFLIKLPGCIDLVLPKGEADRAAALVKAGKAEALDSSVLQLAALGLGLAALAGARPPEERVMAGVDLRGRAVIQEQTLQAGVVAVRSAQGRGRDAALRCRRGRWLPEKLSWLQRGRKRR